MRMNFGAWLLLFLLFVVATTVAAANTTQYDERLAKQLVYLAAGAYSPTPEKCAAKGLPSTHQWRMAISHEAKVGILSDLCMYYALVSDSHRVIYVVFSGTKSVFQLFMQILETIAKDKVNFFGMGKIHPYFFNAHMTLWDSLLPVLSNKTYKDYEVIFTGHSLGGALASIGALRTVYEQLRTIEKIKLYTFGQPRIGNTLLAEFHDLLLPHSFRVVHGFDSVPHFPSCYKNYINIINFSFSITGIGDVPMPKSCKPETHQYYHHSTEIWYPEGMGDNAKYYKCTGTPKNEDFSCSNQFLFQASQAMTGKFIFDHLHYFERDLPRWGEAGCTESPPQVKTAPIINSTNSTSLAARTRTPLAATTRTPLTTITRTPLTTITRTPHEVENVSHNSAVRSTAKIALIVRALTRFLSGGVLLN